MNESYIQAEAYGYFLAEAPELLETIEQEILALPQEHTTTKVHNLMRALHRLKGAAASVGLATIERIAHDLEDVARVFYNLEVEIDVSIQSLLLDGYAGLQACLDAQTIGTQIDEQAILELSAMIISQLKSILGDWIGVDIALPTAMELGFDIVASIFETTVQEQLEALSAIVVTQDLVQIEACLRLMTEMFIGLGESFELPGFALIDRAIVTAIDLHPDRLKSIAYIALTNLRQAQLEVLAGDRLVGGSIRPDLLKLIHSAAPETSSTELAQLPENWHLEIAPADELAELAEDWTAIASTLQFAELTADWMDITLADELAEFAENWTATEPIVELAQIELDAPTATSTSVAIEFDQTLAIASGEAELAGFRAFLTSDKFRTRHGLSAETQDLFDRMIRLCWDWFHQKIHTLHSQLTLELLIAADGLADLDYLHHWIGLLLQEVSTPKDRASLHLYRQSCVYQVIYAVAKYLADTNPLHQITPELLTQLRSHLQTTVVAYQQQPPIRLDESCWLDRIVLPHHWAIAVPSQDPLIDEIWGQPQSANGSLASVKPKAGAHSPEDWQLARFDRLQTILIQSHDRSRQQHQQLQELYAESHLDELAALIDGAAQLFTDLSLALATTAELDRVSTGDQQFLTQIATG